MKKSLLALAVLGAFAGAASAQTNVSIYGVLDAGISHETGAVAGNVTKLASGVQSGNRLGFKGTEDLGGGLKANFTLENGFDIDTGAQRQGGRLFGRQAFVGLSSNNFGAVNLGRQYDPLYPILGIVDPFGEGLTGSATNVMAGGVNGLTAIPLTSDIRVNNSISYTTPNWGGFTGNALYGFGEVPGSTANGRTYGVSGTYANGPITVVAAYSNNRNTTDTNTSKLGLVGGKYDFGIAAIHLAYEREKNDTGLDFQDGLVGVSAPIGPGTLMASFIKKDDRTDLGNAGAKQYAVGYTYALSKRTNFYTSYGYIDNDDGSALFVGDASSGGAGTAVAQGAGNHSSGFAVGVRHKF